MPREIRTILVGVARLDEEESVLRFALELARKRGATLHVVHAFDLPEPIQAAYARRVFLLTRSHLDRYAEELKALLESQLRAISPYPSVVCHVVEGSASESLCELAHEVGADLLLVGATRRSRIWRQFLGTTAEGVIRRSEVPVLVLRQALLRQARHVLFTTDLSELSESVHEEGLELSGALFGSPSTEYHSLLVVQYDSAMPLQLSRDVLERVAGEELERFLQKPTLRDHPVTGRIRIGEPADEILCEAVEWPAELLVLGTHGRSGVHRFLMGSVAGAVLRGAPCNVLVVPALAVGSGSARRVQVERKRQNAPSQDSPMRAGA